MNRFMMSKSVGFILRSVCLGRGFRPKVLIYQAFVYRHNFYMNHEILILISFIECLNSRKRYFVDKEESYL
jgi:hypothetical protein